MASGGELSFDVDKESIEKLKEALGFEEIEARSIRFKNGTETLDDLINHIQGYKIQFDLIKNNEELEVVELKHYKKIVEAYKMCEDEFKRFVTQVKEIRDKLEVMDYYGVPDAIDDLNKILGDEEE